MDRILERFGEVQEEYDHNGATRSSAGREVLTAWASTTRDRRHVVPSPAAGRCAWRWRAFSSAPRLLTDDEPTNHLDIESILWLEAS